MGGGAFAEIIMLSQEHLCHVRRMLPKPCILLTST